MHNFFKKKRRAIAKKIIYYAAAYLVYVYLNVKKIAKETAFHRAFRVMATSKILNYVVQYCEHRHQLDSREYFLLILAKRLAKVGYPYISEITHNNNPHLTNAIKENLSFIVVSVHNGFAFTSKFMSSQHRNVTTIVADRDYVLNKVFKRSGITCQISMIDRDKYCLVKLREALNRQNIVCCDIDFPPSELEKFKYVSPALFVFSHKNNTPMYFARYEISVDGHLSVIFNGPNVIDSPEQKGQAFIRFINQNRQPKRELLLEAF